MLFHLTATHTPDDCPGYNPDRMPEFLAAGPALQEKAKELNIKVLFNVNGAPEHVSFLLLEADDPYSVALFVTELPLNPNPPKEGVGLAS